MNNTPVASPAGSRFAAPVVAIYARVSTAEQTVACQMPDVLALCAARGWTVGVTYEEQASAVKRRPAYEKMMTAAASGRFSILVVWALDRFGRSMSGNINDLLALDKLGVRVVSVREPWLDSGGPVRELLVAIFSWVAQQERARLIERTRAGIAVVRAAGKPWGRRAVGMVGVDERATVMARWDDEGRPDGFRGLAAVLGCASATTARKLWMGRAQGAATLSGTGAQQTEGVGATGAALD